jgi:hypothetical protein
MRFEDAFSSAYDRASARFESARAVFAASPSERLREAARRSNMLPPPMPVREIRYDLLEGSNNVPLWRSMGAEARIAIYDLHRSWGLDWREADEVSKFAHDVIRNGEATECGGIAL